MLYLRKKNNKNKDWLYGPVEKKESVNKWHSDEWEAFSSYYLLGMQAINKQETSGYK